MNDMQSVYFEYLNILRKSGATNMFDAGRFLEHEFELSKKDAKAILLAWMKQFTTEEGNKNATT